jgi:hypothetical protein
MENVSSAQLPKNADLEEYDLVILGGEVLSSVQIAMIGGLPYTALRDAMLTHPTLVEGLIPLFSSVPSVSK